MLVIFSMPALTTLALALLWAPHWKSIFLRKPSASSLMQSKPAFNGFLHYALYQAWCLALFVKGHPTHERSLNPDIWVSPIYSQKQFWNFFFSFQLQKMMISEHVDPALGFPDCCEKFKCACLQVNCRYTRHNQAMHRASSNAKKRMCLVCMQWNCR